MTVFNFFALSPVVTEFWGGIITGGYRNLGWHQHRWLQKSGAALTPVVTEIWGGISTAGYRDFWVALTPLEERSKEGRRKDRRKGQRKVEGRTDWRKVEARKGRRNVEGRADEGRIEGRIEGSGGMSGYKDRGSISGGMSG